MPWSNDIKMYVCGVTPYSDSHVGHAMSYIYFDVIRRYLKLRGYSVKYVQNLTDIDDKIIDRASRLNIPVGELAGKYIDAFFADMDALNILRADVYPRATEEIPKMLEIIQSLVKGGYAYPAKGSVYFRVRSVPDYGKLSHRTLDSMEAGIRIEPGEEKEHPMDFVLWKASKPNEPSWHSSWGPGRPGWHIECSAMSVKYLGETIDIHGGGQDLIFPHHENETVQSESFTGKKPFVKYWMHNGLLRLGEEKMSKSLGNLVTIKEALSRYSSDGIRLFVLSSHYRSPLTYSEEALAAAERGVTRLREAVFSEGGTGEKIDFEPPFRLNFSNAMDDDFNTSQAIAILFDMARAINRFKLAGRNVVPGQQLLLELASVLGLTLRLPAEAPVDIKALEEIIAITGEQIRKAGLRIDIAASVLDVDSAMGLIISLRKHLREARQWQLADDVRKQLDEMGISIEDTSKGTVWKSKR